MSADIAPSSANAAKSGARRSVLKCATKHIVAAASASVCSESGENQQNALQTGSEQQKNATPWKSTTLTATRHHAATCSPRLSVVGRAIFSRVAASRAMSPSETLPAARRMTHVVCRPNSRQSQATP